MKKIVLSTFNSNFIGNKKSNGKDAFSIIFNLFIWYPNKLYLEYKCRKIIKSFLK